MAWGTVCESSKQAVDCSCWRFVFPTQAVLHIPHKEDLALKRLQLCQRYLVLKPLDFVPPGAPPRRALAAM